MVVNNFNYAEFLNKNGLKEENGNIIDKTTYQTITTKDEFLSCYHKYNW